MSSKSFNIAAVFAGGAAIAVELAEILTDWERAGHVSFLLLALIAAGFAAVLEKLEGME